MAIISKITTQQKNKERYNIFLDYGKGEEYAFSVDQDVMVKHQLKKGMELDELDITGIQFEDEVKKAFNDALVFLSYRMRSTKEIVDHLKKKEVDEPIIPEVIHKLSEYNYINDKEFAQAYVNTQINTTSKGPEVIKQELFEKGIDPALIQECLLVFTQEMQIEKACKLIEKARKQSSKMSQVLFKQKIEQALIRKGYTWNTINISLEEVDVSKDQDEQWDALKFHGQKAYQKYNQLEEWAYEQKMKQTLYRKGFSIEMIQKFLDEMNS